MTKREFLNELERLTAALSEGERARLIEYYGEMIDDRIEEGVGEADAVAALGAPEEVAKAFAPVPVRQGSAEAVPALNGLRLRVTNADVTVVRAPIENGAAAQLRFTDPERFTWRMDGDTLEVTQPEADEPRFSLGWLRQMITSPAQRVTVTLSGPLDGTLDFEGGGSDLLLDGVTVGALALRSASGDIELKAVTCGADAAITARSGDIEINDLRAASLRVNTASGDIEAAGLTATGEIRLETASGDLELRNVDCDGLDVITASGDIEIDRGSAGATAIRTASGDVRLDELESDPTLDLETASGDIDLTRCIAREARLRTASGDVTLRLEPLPCGYDLNVNSARGDIHFDDTLTADPDAVNPGVLQPKFNIQTVSGDVNARVAR